jgi:death on curing protein
MTEYIWLTADMIVDIHASQLAAFGGPGGIRDHGMLESAIARPRNQFAYGETDLCQLAASYAFGIAKNHPFVDGNKRAAFLAAATFLRLNGVRFAPKQMEAAAAILGTAAGEISEDGLARWIRDNLPKAP